MIYNMYYIICETYQVDKWELVTGWTRWSWRTFQTSAIPWFAVSNPLFHGREEFQNQLLKFSFHQLYIAKVTQNSGDMFGCSPHVEVQLWKLCLSKISVARFILPLWQGWARVALMVNQDHVSPNPNFPELQLLPRPKANTLTITSVAKHGAQCHVIHEDRPAWSNLG